DMVNARKKNAEDTTGIFEMYYSYQEPIRKIVPHRVLAINRGEKLGILGVRMEYDMDRLKRYIGKQEIKEKSATGRYMETAVADALKRLIMPSIEREVRSGLTENGEQHAIDIFAENLKGLLLQPPLKGRVILGLDPAFRTGCKMAVIDHSGQFIDKG